ncbi:MAG TPA: ParA family protein [Firmicutes bacterium]|nr:ParA family protein [Bacillota bacterium]
MALIIAVVNPKGGVGKTTTAINIASSLAIIQRPTLLIDMDPDGACAIGLGFDPSAIHGGVFDVFTDHTSLSTTIHQTSLPYLHFIPTNVVTSDHESQFAEVAADRRLMRDLLRGPVADSYEFVILDCPPSLANVTINALVAADTVLIPVNASQFAVKAIIRLIKLIRILRDKQANEKLTVAGLLVTMHDKRTRVGLQIEKDLRDMFKHLVFDTTIPINTRVNEANYKGRPVVTYDVNGAGSVAYMDATLELLSRVGKTPRRRSDVALGHRNVAHD